MSFVGVLGSITDYSVKLCIRRLETSQMSSNTVVSCDVLHRDAPKCFLNTINFSSLVELTEL